MAEEEEGLLSLFLCLFFPDLLQLESDLPEFKQMIFGHWRRKTLSCLSL